MADPCQSNPCLFNGSCVTKNDKAECLCESPHFGKVCELQRTTCNEISCENGATCLQSNVSDAVCLCPNGFGGARCQNGYFMIFCF